MLNSFIPTYVHRSVIERLLDSKQNLPSRDEAIALNRMPHIDALRGAVQSPAEALSLLKRIEEATSSHQRGLLISLTHQFSTAEKVKERLLSIWDQYNEDSIVKDHVLFRLLDDPEVDHKLRCDIYQYIRDNEDRFSESQSFFYANPKQYLSITLQRLHDPKCPKSKHWLYLYNIALLRRGVPYIKILLKTFRATADDFCRDVIDYVLAQYWDVDRQHTNSDMEDLSWEAYASIYRNFENAYADIAKQGERSDKLNTLYKQYEDRDPLPASYKQALANNYGASAIVFGVSYADHFSILQRRELHRDGERSANLPRICISWTQEDCRNPLVDTLFIGRRIQQNDLAAHPPEFLNTLPWTMRLGRLRARQILPETMLDALLNMPTYQNLRLLHCGSGEMLFFMYLWRCWISDVASQDDGWRAKLDNRGYVSCKKVNQPSMNHTKAVDLWDVLGESLKSDQNDHINEAFPERSLLQQIEDAVQACSSDRSQAQPQDAWSIFYKEVLHGIHTDGKEACNGFYTNDRLKLDELSGFKEDLMLKRMEQLGLIASTPDESYQILPRARLLCAYLRLIVCDASDDQLSCSTNAILSVCEEIETLPIITIVDKPSGIFTECHEQKASLLERLDCCIRSLGMHLAQKYFRLTDVKVEALLADHLFALHQISRFPIIPFFYLNALQPDKQSPLKEHLVLPLWDSYDSPLKLQLGGETKTKVICPTIVWALLAVSAPEDQTGSNYKQRQTKPRQAQSQELQNDKQGGMTPAHYDYHYDAEFRLSHFIELRQLLLQAAHPLIDHGIYGGYIKKHFEAAARNLERIETQYEMTRNLSHSIKNALLPVAMPANELREVAIKALTEFEIAIMALINSFIQASPHDVDAVERFMSNADNLQANEHVQKAMVSFIETVITIFNQRNKPGTGYLDVQDKEEAETSATAARLKYPFLSNTASMLAVRLVDLARGSKQVDRINKAVLRAGEPNRQIQLRVVNHSNENGRSIVRYSLSAAIRGYTTKLRFAGKSDEYLKGLSVILGEDISDDEWKDIAYNLTETLAPLATADSDDNSITSSLQDLNGMYTLLHNAKAQSIAEFQIDVGHNVDEIAGAPLESDPAIVASVVLTELFLNAFKHARPSNEKKLRIRININARRSDGVDWLTIRVSNTIDKKREIALLDKFKMKGFLSSSNLIAIKNNKFKGVKANLETLARLGGNHFSEASIAVTEEYVHFTVSFPFIYATGGL